MVRLGYYTKRLACKVRDYTPLEIYQMLIIFNRDISKIVISIITPRALHSLFEGNQIVVT